MENKFGDSLTELRSAYQEGMKNMQLMSGQSGDRDVRLYGRMKPRDFAVLAKHLGTNVVLDYIKDMELKRLREKNNG